MREVHRHTIYTTSVCTGSLVLAAAGLLSGLTAATHWRGVELLESFGAVYTPQRVVEHLPERIITAAGVSSGIDMALRLLELLVDREAAQAAQLMIEYDPQPPFDTGPGPRPARRSGSGRRTTTASAAESEGEQTQNRTIRGRKGRFCVCSRNYHPARRS